MLTRAFAAPTKLIVPNKGCDRGVRKDRLLKDSKDDATLVDARAMARRNPDVCLMSDLWMRTTDLSEQRKEEKGHVGKIKPQKFRGMMLLLPVRV